MILPDGFRRQRRVVSGAPGLWHGSFATFAAQVILVRHLTLSEDIMISTTVTYT